ETERDCWAPLAPGRGRSGPVQCTIYACVVTEMVAGRQGAARRGHPVRDRPAVCPRPATSGTGGFVGRLAATGMVGGFGSPLPGRPRLLGPGVASANAWDRTTVLPRRDDACVFSRPS